MISIRYSSFKHEMNLLKVIHFVESSRPPTNVIIYVLKIYTFPLKHSNTYVPVGAFSSDHTKPLPF